MSWLTIGNLLTAIPVLYLCYSSFHTGTYVYSFWNPPECDPTITEHCLCPRYHPQTSIEFDLYLSKQKQFNPQQHGQQQGRRHHLLHSTPRHPPTNESLITIDPSRANSPSSCPAHHGPTLTPLFLPFFDISVSHTQPNERETNKKHKTKEQFDVPTGN